MSLVIFWQLPLQLYTLYVLGLKKQGFRAHIISFQDKILFCSKIEDLLIWFKCFKSYLHDSVIILASESLFEAKNSKISVNIFQKVTKDILAWSPSITIIKCK